MIRDAGTSKHGEIRSNSVVILPNGDATEDAGELELAWQVLAENLRSYSRTLRAAGLRAAHRRVLPPIRPNMIPP